MNIVYFLTHDSVVVYVCANLCILICLDTNLILNFYISLTHNYIDKMFIN